MANSSTFITAFLGGGTITGLVAFAKFLRDEERHRRAERKAAQQEQQAAKQEAEEKPIQAQAATLGLVERATVIQQRAIESLEAQVEDWSVRHQLYKKDTDEKIERLEKKITELGAALQQRDAYIAELQGVISKQEIELHGKRRRQAPGT
jgi:predicted RNase H-like nuclease (RuvC/YqgF family)